MVSTGQSLRKARQRAKSGKSFLMEVVSWNLEPGKADGLVDGGGGWKGVKQKRENRFS